MIQLSLFQKKNNNVLPHTPPVQVLPGAQKASPHLHKVSGSIKDNSGHADKAHKNVKI